MWAPRSACGMCQAAAQLLWSILALWWRRRGQAGSGATSPHPSWWQVCLDTRMSGQPASCACIDWSMDAKHIVWSGVLTHSQLSQRAGAAVHSFVIRWP